jgi:hypothetical protein
MKELSPIAKDALAALRARDTLDPVAKSRLRARLEVSIAAGTALPVSTSAHGTGPRIAGLDARAIAIRVALPVAIAAAVLLGLWAIAPGRGSERAAARGERGSPEQAAFDAEPDPRRGDAEAKDSRALGQHEPWPAAPVASEADAGKRAPLPSAPRAPARTAPDHEPEPVSDTTLAEEMRVLRRARAAMRDGDPSRALTELEAHAAAFAHGQMSEDRDALRIEALCAADRAPEARAAAAAFARAVPRSPHAARVQKLCAAP